MTRDEWLSGMDPLEMVNAAADKLTDRKLRLFLVACCRRLWHLPAGPRLRDAAEAAERFADGACDQEEMERAARAAGEAVDSANHGQPWPGLTKASRAVFLTCLPPGYLGTPCGSFTGRYMRGSYWVMRGVDAAAEAAANHAVPLGRGDSDAVLKQILARERTEQCRLLRDVAGDPFHPVVLDPSWRTPDVVTLAGHIYWDLAFEPLQELADALEEAGCTNGEILAHCRGRGDHVRGCWVVDRLLGKE